MGDSIQYNSEVEGLRSIIDAGLGRFDRSFFLAGGVDFSPLDYRDEWEVVSDAVAALDEVLERLFEGAEVAAEDALRDIAAAGPDESWEDVGFHFEEA